jgi:AraC family transcriptional regulator
MNPAQTALWFIESHLAGALTLDEVAAVAGVSRFHLVRAFAAATGFSVMRYVRARRLSEAARALANGAPDILTVALDADYGSHEAFTRAFREHFGVTPEAVRGSAHLDDLKLQEAITMDSTVIDNLKPPRFEISKPRVSASVTLGSPAPPFRASGSAFTSRFRTFRAGSARWPTASAAMATTPAITPTLPASK